MSMSVTACRAASLTPSGGRARKSATRRQSPQLRKYHEYGGGTFVDATGICNGRDVDYFKSLSAKTGVHFVACTGFVGGDTALPFFAQASVEYLAQQFIHEITVGIGDTGSKAGIIKVGVSRGFRMTELDKRIYRAAARAAVITGVPIFSHLAVDSQPAIDIFHEEGLALDRVLFGHVDDGPSQGKVRDTEIADQGGPAGVRQLWLRLRLARPSVLGAAAPGAARPLPAIHPRRIRRQTALLSRCQLQPARLARRERPYRQLSLRGSYPRPAALWHRGRNDHKDLRRQPRRLPGHQELRTEEPRVCRPQTFKSSTSP